MTGRTLLSRRAVQAAACTLASLAAWLPRGRRAEARPSSIVGAIRWDPWYGPPDSSERQAVERTLGPAAFQDRAPDFAVRTSPDTLRIEGGTAAEIDREIGLARGAGLSFWAYCFYPEGSPMMAAWALHQASARRAEMNWCVLAPSFAWFEGEVAVRPERFAAFFAQGNYQRVLGGRPLLFLLEDGTPATRLRAGIDALRAAASRAGQGTPYVAIMSWSPARTGDEVRAAGADAVSAYSAGSPAGTAPYAALDRAVRAEWDEMARTGLPCIPLAVLGKDRRPRVANPVPWEAARQKPGEGADRFFTPGTPAEIAGHVRAAVAWVENHRAACPAQCSVIYSWDECDEGGSTLLPSLGGGDAILKAVGEVLR